MCPLMGRPWLCACCVALLQPLGDDDEEDDEPLEEGGEAVVGDEYVRWLEPCLVRSFQGSRGLAAADDHRCASIDAIRYIQFLALAYLA